MRKGFQANDDGTLTVALANIWDRCRRWSKRHGHVYEPTYGVVGVAPL